MNKKYIRRAFVFLCFAVLVFVAALWYRNGIEAGQVRGKYAFIQTRNNIRSLQRIQMTTAESGEINVYRKGEDWHFKEAKDYFINVNRLADFYNMVNNSLVEGVYPVQPEVLAEKLLLPENGTQVVTYGADGNILDEIIIGAHSNGASAYAYNPKNPRYYYIISDVGAFAGHAEDWIPYPLLTIEAHLIKSIKTSKTVLNHEQIRRAELTNPEMQRILSVLSFISYDGISEKSELFSSEAKEVRPRILEITMAGGLIYVFEIYKIEDTYWLGITLKADRISRKEIPPFVKNNQKYFADWLFLMNTRQGNTLYNM